MATETVYATSHITGAFSNPANAVGSGTGTWAGDLNVNSNYTSRWAIGDPTDPLTSGATQTVRVLARKGSNSGTPTITLNLWENGSLVQEILAATNITSTTGQTLTATFPTSAITNRADVEIEVVQTSAGGSPSARNSAQIDYIAWDAETTPIVDQNIAALALAAPASVFTTGVLRDEVAVAPHLAAPAAVATPGVAVGPVTAVAPKVVTSPTVRTPGVLPGAVAAVAPLLATATVAYAPGASRVLVVPHLSAPPAVVQTPERVMVAVDVVVTMPHIYV